MRGMLRREHNVGLDVGLDWISLGYKQRRRLATDRRFWQPAGHPGSNSLATRVAGGLPAPPVRKGCIECVLALEVACWAFIAIHVCIYMRVHMQMRMLACGCYEHGCLQACELML